MPWHPQAQYRLTFTRNEGKRKVAYYNTPAAYEQPNVDTIVYDLGRATVIVWDGPTHGKEPLRLSRGGWS